MQILKFFILLFICSSIKAQVLKINQDPQFVRVRLFKALEKFPQVVGGKIKKINDSVWSLTGEKLQFQNKELPPVNVVVKNAEGFEIISVLDFNEYLGGVVANEMPLSWPLEALKAQAVVARSFALVRIKERHAKYFHLDSDQSDQVYSVNHSLKAREAVLETEASVLQKPTGEVLKAYYHADCGGQTVRAEDVWGADSFDSGTAVDPWCASRERNRWSYEVSKADFAEKLGVSKEQLQQLGTLINSRRDQLLSIAESVFSVQKIRQILGFSQVKNTPKLIEFGGATVKISGQGYGHGAGLCQWGSLALARQGKNYREIVAHYYPKAKISEDAIKLTLNLEARWPGEAVSN